MPFAGGQQAGEHLHGGGFAAAIRAEKAENLPALDAEVDVVDRNKIAEAHAQVARLDGNFLLACRAWRDHQLLMALAFSFRHQGDKRLFQT